MRIHRMGLLALCLIAAACGRTHPDPGATQVVARVNTKEITILQLNAALAQVPNVTAETAKAASGPLLERLIEQELLVQKAQDAKLDRNPQVAQAMEAAKRQVLATAYLQQFVADVPKPSDQEIHDYFAHHPEYFEARRVYTYRSIPVTAPPSEVQAIEHQVSTSQDVDAVMATLRANKLPFAVNSASKAAEQLPAEALPAMAAMKEGQAATFPFQGGVEIVQLVSSRAEPVGEVQARPFIEKFLLERSRRERADAEIKALRSLASIKYTGTFKAPDAKAADPKPTANDVTTGIATGLK